MTTAAALSHALGSALADMWPTEHEAKCPKCGGKLLTTVTVYVRQPVRFTLIGRTVSRIYQHAGKGNLR